MQTYTVEREHIIYRPRSEVFAFFGDAFNLELITPPFLRFRILTEPPVSMRAGALIDYRLQLFGLPFGWRTRIDEWSPEEVFVDRQIEGPYALWHHTHTFDEIAPNKTRMRDLVLYQIPYGPVGRLARALFIRKTLDHIFDYRQQMTARLLAPDRKTASNKISGLLKSAEGRP